MLESDARNFRVHMVDPLAVPSDIEADISKDHAIHIALGVVIAFVKLDCISLRAEAGEVFGPIRGKHGKVPWAQGLGVISRQGF